MTALPLSKLSDNRLTRPIKRWAVKHIAAKRSTRDRLNRWYNRLDEDAKNRFHFRYAKIFRDHTVPIEQGEWAIPFLGRSIKLPLRPEVAWLDWDNAVSIIGHDLEIKQTYAALLQGQPRPTLFIDIGANYGMHSTLFLSAGIPVLAFEPNPACAACFQAVCALNGFSARREAVAIGNTVGTVELVYPERETWLGSVAKDVVTELRERGNISVQVTPMKRLDDYLGDIPDGNIVIKIDVEGLELDVLSGGEQVISKHKPVIIFESNDGRLRPGLLRAFNRLNYIVHALPWLPSRRAAALNPEAFVSSKSHNFIAINREQPIG
jgi:FkbM family methyltransferase